MLAAGGTTSPFTIPPPPTTPDVRHGGAWGADFANFASGTADHAAFDQSSPRPRPNVDSFLKRRQQNWQRQWLMEQILQREPWRRPARQRPADHAPSTEAVRLRKMMEAPLQLNGQEVQLRGAGTPIFDERNGRPTRPRTDHGRWPPAPPVEAESALHSPRGMLTKPACQAAASLGPRSAPPATPAGQCASANARRLGAAYVSRLTPRDNLSRPGSPPERSTPGEALMVVEVPQTTMPSAIFDTEIHLDKFMGQMNSVLVPPMVAQPPIFDPRRATTTQAGGEPQGKLGRWDSRRSSRHGSRASSPPHSNRSGSRSISVPGSPRNLSRLQSPSTGWRVRSPSSNRTEEGL